MDEIKYRPIGVIHSSFGEPRGVPIQPSSARGIDGTVEVFPEYAEGLEDLDGFSHILLVYHFHLSRKVTLKAKPYMDDRERGVFAMRGPSRPNPIGISVVRLIRVQENMLYVWDLDIVDGTPLLDIKPYVPRFDIMKDEVKTGWLEKKIHKLPTAKDDGRFVK